MRSLHLCMTSLLALLLVGSLQYLRSDILRMLNLKARWAVPPLPAGVRGRGLRCAKNKNVKARHCLYECAASDYMSRHFLIPAFLRAAPSLHSQAGKNLPRGAIQKLGTGFLPRQGLVFVDFGRCGRSTVYFCKTKTIAFLGQWQHVK